MTTLTGIDVSRHQGVIDWPAVRRAGHAFAILKATDSTSYQYIGWFRENFPRARAAGLVPGAYHFLTRADGAAQARYYVAEVQRAGGFDGTLAVVDVETNVDRSHPSIDTARAFAAEFRRLVPGHPLVVYTGRWFWDGILRNPHGADLGPLWHSAYGAQPGALYGGWDRFTIWQHTSSGACPGVAGRVDLNRFYGDHTDLAALTRQPPQEDPDMPDVRLLDCAGRPALLFGAGAPQRLNTTQRSALRALDIEPETISTTTHDALVSLIPPPPVTTVEVDVDEEAIAAAVATALGDRADDVTVANIVAGVRGVFADAGAPG